MSVASGAIGLGASVSGTTAAKRPERADPEAIDEALDDPKVQSIMEELGFPKVLPNRSVTTTEATEEITVRVTHIPTQVGSITYGIRADGTTEAMFPFKDVRGRGLLPEVYRNLPQADSAILKGLEDDVVLTRLATDRERDAMLDDLDIDPETASAYIDSKTEEFTLKYTDENDTVQQVDVTGGSVYSESAIDEFGYHKPTTDDGGLSIMDHNGKCDQADWCWRCLQTAGACGACYASCSAVGPGCALCITAFCGGGGYACTGCIDCNT